MDQFADLPFPAGGVSTEWDFSGQAPRSTPLGQNVRVFEPLSFRGRGGSRAGLSKFIAQQLAPGHHVVQHLGTVTMASESAIPIPALDPGSPDLVIDPSTAGPPDSWGTGPLYIDPNTGMPVSGSDLHTRAPGDGVNPRKTRKRGSGFQPNKNTLTGAPPPASPRGCFQGFIEIIVTKPPPDIYGFTGTKPGFYGVGCMPFNPPTQPAPGSAEIIPIGSDYLNLGAAAGMPILSYAKLWLAVKVGSDAYGVVTIDRITDPATVTQGDCSGSGPCSAATPTFSPAASAVGTTIMAG